MIVLDTNIISALMQKRPDPVVIEWLDAQPPTSIWTTSICVFEIRFGLNVLPAGKRRQGLQDLFEGALRQELGGRVMQFDALASEHAAAIAAKTRRIGRPVEIRDVMIAGIVDSKGATLVTRNTRHFKHAGISLVDPWTSSK